MEKTIARRPSQPSEAMANSGLTGLLQRIYAARGIETPTQLETGLKQLASPQQLKGIDAAVELLQEGLQAQWAVLIVGDFDADGATSTAVAMEAMAAMGFQQLDYLVPNRFEYGYGLTPEIVEVAAQRQPMPTLLVTVDNGISSIEGVARAQALGMKVLVTDHHLAGAELPKAEAMVNPNQPDCDFPSKNLAGVGVIFYVMMALRAKLREEGWFETQGLAEPNLASLLDLVALGTVADVVSLDQNNRILVQQGIGRIRAGHCRPGIQALLNVAGRDAERVSSTDFGFVLGPRLNAAGRLDDMSLGISCLLASSLPEATALAQELDELNRDRKSIEQSMQQEAQKNLDQLDMAPEQLPWGMCLYQADWHQGVIGILASRMKDQYHRPVIAFADSGDEHGVAQVKGSARSIQGLHIRDALDRVAARHPGLLNKFGGHAMAAGLSLAKDQLPDFKQAFDDVVRECLDEGDLQERVLTDGNLAAQELQLSIAEQLRQAGPWGQNFPEPVFDGEFYIVNHRIVGSRHLKLTLSQELNGQSLIDAIAFNVDVNVWPNYRAKKCRLVYKLDVNEFRGRRSLQLMVDYIEVLEEA